MDTEALKLNSSEKQRIFILDEIRGTAIVCMFFYHMTYTLGFVFGNAAAITMFDFFTPFEPIFAGLFIFISGICTKLSRSNLRRGIILFFIAVGVNVFTAVFMPDFVIKFGVLNLLSICMIFYGLFDKIMNKVPAVAGFCTSIAIFILTWGVSERYIGILRFPIVNLPENWYGTEYLFPFGFQSEDFFSTDFFPIFPWFFAFMTGAFFIRFFENVGLSTEFYKKHIPFLASIGKYSLWIYLLHQPLIFALAYFIKFLI